MNLNNLCSICKDSDTLAIVDYTRNVSVTYKELNQLARNVSNNIPAGLGDIVIINLKNSIEFVACFLGVMMSGGVSAISKVTDYSLEINESNVDSLLKESQFNHDTFNPSDSDMAFVTTSSGSTGIPKTIRYTHKKHLHNVNKIASSVKSKQENVLIVTPLSHMFGLSNLEIALACGHTVYIMNKFDSDSMIDCIDKCKITKIPAVPSVFEIILRNDKIKNCNTDSVKSIRVGAALCKPETMNKITSVFKNAEVFNSYGISEIGPGLFGYHPRGIPKPPLSVGYPLPGFEYRIIDGVLQIKTPFMNVSNLTDDGYYITNDLFEVDNNGFYYCLGRCDDVFKSGGYTVNPIEVETEIEKIAGVKQAIVIPVPDDIKENKPICIIICDIETERINSQLSLAEYKKPRKYIKVDSLPLNDAGKVDRKKLKRDYE
jgi:acyl-coenzyme A synthetase/AMP-(fatty) acid ligase